MIERLVLSLLLLPFAAVFGFCMGIYLSRGLRALDPWVRWLMGVL